MIYEIQPDTRLPKDKRIKIYTALLTQSGTNAPTVTILQNTLGTTITWTRSGAGSYVGATAEDTFTLNKTALLITGGLSGNYYAGYTSPIQIFVTTTGDDKLVGTTLEIRVYTE